MTADSLVFEISKAVTFEAAHTLPPAPGRAGYARVHGHSFQLKATVAGQARPSEAWVEDLGRLAEALNAAAAELDHRLLNEIDGLGAPTLENIAVWAARRLQGDLPGLSAVEVARPSLSESCTLRLQPRA